MDALVNKQSFIGLPDCTWLYSGAEVPPHQGCLDAVAEYFNYRAKGPKGRIRNAEVEQSCKVNIASLLNGKPSDIALLSNSSEVISMIAHSLDFKEGDNVVINDLEFPSGVLPWVLLRKMGLEVRVVHHTNWQVTVEDIMAQVDDRTRLVMTSHVSYLTGARLDYRSLYALLKHTGTLLFLDATQSLGAIPVDMNDSDFVVCSSYKWLLSTHGMGILAINPARTADFQPRAVGWRSVTDMFGPDRFESFAFHEDARRFELGFPSYPTVYAANFSTGLLLEQGIDRIEQHILKLGGMVIERLLDRGYEVMTPVEPGRRAGNISVVSEHGEAIANHLSEHNIYVWGGDGRFRISVHLFNDEEDINNLFRELGTYKK
ncbi:aminotransferase class V-fold PLP-dependent enzyme [Cohnella silvisoli]|uniref:Aminotransferase class V-fold PLP-dependent enzyme n=1 Tax=Cohnella silvisoli TaxID=2873699 RepID=A0ABV1KTG3_9BACL|nr:aminotransferase class V-fold PLP-dependent enzyme [Cohnella silvisoli]MCD9022463.1 aminotransferase class V-fold PLP-dependent enzyme [Cohnella silvisoli]